MAEIDIPNYRYLIVDDDKVICTLLKDLLSKQGASAIAIADNGKVAMRLIKAANQFPDIIICDLNMPKMSGMEAISHFRSQFPSCPVIVMTGAGTVEKVTTLFKQGVVEFLVKPINQEQLLGAVKKAVNKG